MMSPEAAGAAAQAGEHEIHSLVYWPVNAAWHWLLAATGLDRYWGRIEVPEHVAMSLFVMLLCAAIFIPLRFRFKKERPGKLQHILEVLIEEIEKLIEDIVGHGAGRRYLPIIGALALFIFFGNVCGLFFFLQPPTANLNTTCALSISVFLYYNYIGLRRHGVSYFKQFLGPIGGMPVAMAIPFALLFLVIEPITHAARAVSLAVRLFGNISGEHTVSGQFFGFAPILLPIPMMALGLFAALLQAFIFIMLTMVYIAGAETTEH